jgi:hypothetical protein
MPSERSIRTQLTNTYLSRAIETRDEVEGRFAKEESSEIVGAGAKYPRAHLPFSDDLNAVLNAARDEFGVDLMAAPDLGEPPFKFTGGDRRALPELAVILARMDEDALKHEVAKASLEQKTLFEDTDRIAELQNRIDACRWELDRRRL